MGKDSTPAADLPRTVWKCESCNVPLCLNERRDCYYAYHKITTVTASVVKLSKLGPVTVLISYRRRDSFMYRPHGSVTADFCSN